MLKPPSSLHEVVVVESASVVSKVLRVGGGGCRCRGTVRFYWRVAGNMPVVGMVSVQLCTVVLGGAWSAWWCSECLGGGVVSQKPRFAP